MSRLFDDALQLFQDVWLDDGCTFSSARDLDTYHIKTVNVRNSRHAGRGFHVMPGQHFTSCRASVSRQAGPAFHPCRASIS